MMKKSLLFALLAGQVCGFVSANDAVLATESTLEAVAPVVPSESTESVVAPTVVPSESSDAVVSDDAEAVKKAEEAVLAKAAELATEAAQLNVRQLIESRDTKLVAAGIVTGVLLTLVAQSAPVQSALTSVKSALQNQATSTPQAT